MPDNPFLVTALRAATLDALMEGDDIIYPVHARAFLHELMDRAGDWATLMLVLPASRRLCAIPGWKKRLRTDDVLEYFGKRSAIAQQIAALRGPPGVDAMTEYLVGLVTDYYQQVWKPYPCPTTSSIMRCRGARSAPTI